MGSQELALLLLLFLPLCSAQSTYYVTPTPDTPCPREPCFSLSEYLTGQVVPLNSTELTFMLLPGDHIIDNDIPMNIGQLTSLNMFGDSASYPEVTSVIICSQPTSFTFSQISRFYISGIAFKSCGSLSDAPMKLEQVFQAEISNCLFQGGQSGALAVVDSTLILLENRFENNSAIAISTRGGGVYMKSCTANVSGNIFLNNSAGEGGGVYLEDSMVHFTSNVFENNAVLSSGIYYNSGDSTLAIDGGSAPDIESSHGGGVYMKDSTANVSKNVFVDNSAERLGGGVFLEDSEVHFDSNMFKNNTAYGGGALAIKSNSTTNVSGNDFNNNIADEIGGGVYLEDSKVHFASNMFKNNTASFDGGALAIKSNSTANISGNVFVLNSASKGGGAVYSEDSIVSFTSNVFNNNTAFFYIIYDDYYTYYRGGGSGGAAYLEDSTVHFASNVFNSNVALFSESDLYNYDDDGGGGALAIRSSDVNISDNSFTNNIARGAHGGGVFVKDSTAKSSGNIFVNNRAEKRGGGVYLENCGVSFDSNLFKNNDALYGGGIATYIDVLVNVSENVFENNSAAYGGGLYVNRSDAVNVFGNTFTNNTVSGGGAGIFLLNCRATYTGKITFRNNSVSVTRREIETVNNYRIRGSRGDFLTSSDGAIFAGGAMLIGYSDIMFLGNIGIENSNAIYGGGIAAFESNLVFSSTVDVRDNTAIYGGSVFFIGSTVTFSGLTDFINNRADDSGGAVYAIENSKLYFDGEISFRNNTAIRGGGVCVLGSVISFSGLTDFANNDAKGSGGAVYAIESSEVYFAGNISFEYNTAEKGGGLFLADSSQCYFSATELQLCFVQNQASENGGAIYVSDTTPSDYCGQSSASENIKSNCFFQVQTYRTLYFLSDIQSRIYFYNNTANEGGGDLYGGTIDNCELPSVGICSECDFKSSGDVFNTMTAENLDIASVPLQVCSCETQILSECSQSFLIDVYPGKTINVSVTVLGQRNGIVSTNIQTQTTGNITIPELQKIQSSTISQRCSNLSFTAFSPVNFGSATLILSTDGPCSSDHNSLVIQVQIQRCPHGFRKSNTAGACDCDKRLTRFTGVTCDVRNGMVFRPTGSELWVGYDNDSDSLILYPQCPFDYCTENEQYVNVDDSDTQCNYNRTGKLCGGCGGNTSLVLGSSRCMQCSNSYLALTIPFALAGIALVLFLFILKLTVAVGTINGLIFYANLVQVNSSVFYKSVNTNILTVFISWLNLDLGIQTCFYNGMDAYTKTWLQFVFPIYVWSLVGLIIFISHFSRKITSLLGSNPIAVLATLFLISYTKILRTIIAALSFRYLEYPDGINVAVWTYDGNMEYFSGKHIPLFITALLSLIFLFLPFTLLLFLGQWIRTLQAKTEWRILSWINKPTFRAFLDAYHAPYASSHRYWTGLLLLVRCILFIIFATTGDTRADLFAVSTAVTGLITFALATTGIYRNRYFGILEASFFLNLVLLTTATNHVQAVGGNQAAVTLISLSIAFTTFAGIVVYHIFLQNRGTKLSEMVARIYSNRLSKKSHTVQLLGTEEKIESNKAAIPTTFVELREPLLDDN